ncbi:hypothetical protein PIB30_091542 [Stylosanthes scabra]|uniref:Lysozyme inhibitor LprI N-terminal domain-containing protein n=1 Tax=Stylosanthes scabra TaxID=79078 RepID=A0ABU6QTZ9_9FABA|nr:hypothetical protein [Stylosanthes scabra]
MEKLLIFQTCKCKKNDQQNNENSEDHGIDGTINLQKRKEAYQKYLLTGFRTEALQLLRREQAQWLQRRRTATKRKSSGGDGNEGNVGHCGTTSGGCDLQWSKSAAARVVVGLGGHGGERRERWRLALGWAK